MWTPFCKEKGPLKPPRPGAKWALSKYNMLRHENNISGKKKEEMFDDVVSSFAT